MRVRVKHYTIETLALNAILGARFLSYTIKSWDNSQVESGKYTSNCRENKDGTIPNYSLLRSMILQGIELGKYFPAIAGNVPSYCTEYYQACKCFYHSV